jgi:hypothetical protein
MSYLGKQIIAGFAAKLAPTQQNKIVVNGYTDNTPVGPELRRQGITSNQVLSQKHAGNRCLPNVPGLMQIRNAGYLQSRWQLNSQAQETLAKTVPMLRRRQPMKLRILEWRTA